VEKVTVTGVEPTVIDPPEEELQVFQAIMAAVALLPQAMMQTNRIAWIIFFRMDALPKKVLKKG
jgi:hypothetical protein